MTPDQADEDDADEAERSLRPGVMSDDHADEEFDRVEEELRRNNDSLNPRLSRISVCPVLLPKDPLAHYQTESTTSLRTSHDKLQALQKHNTELGRKLKEAEKQLAVLGCVYTFMQAADVQVRERKAGRGSPREA
jgi:epoxyqueuosine reductase QueG